MIASHSSTTISRLPRKISRRPGALYRDLHHRVRPAALDVREQFPGRQSTCSYQVLWNAFKRIAAGYSTDEKTALFSGAPRKPIAWRV